MPGLLVNIDVPDTAAAGAFYTRALGLSVGRRFGADFVELLGADAPFHLLRKQAGTPAGAAGGGARAAAAGAVQEGGTGAAPHGRLAMLADPFGHGFRLIALNERGYDALLD